MKVNISKARNRLSALIRSAQAGEEVIIANRGEPVARLVAVKPAATPEPRKGSAEAILRWLDENPLLAGSRRTADEIDQLIEDNRNAWD